MLISYGYFGVISSCPIMLPVSASIWYRKARFPVNNPNSPFLYWKVPSTSHRPEPELPTGVCHALRNDIALSFSA
jgi:hypothetical protein